MYDVAIVGSGPAAVSAALNLKLHNKEVIWFGSKELSSKVQKSEKIANYPGVPMVSGTKLNEIFKEQIVEMGLEITEKMVTNIMSNHKVFMLLADNDIYEAKSVLLATGAVSAKGFPGEDEFLGRGVSYCATCDGFLYKDKILAVYCSSKRYEHEVKYLADLARRIYLFIPYKDSEINLPNVEISEGKLGEIKGDSKVKQIILTDGTEIDADGVFILRESVAPGTILKGLEMEGAHISVDRKMATSKEGVFAAGDCTGRPYQNAKAVGEGNVAAHSILEYLDDLDKETEKNAEH